MASLISLWTWRASDISEFKPGYWDETLFPLPTKLPGCEESAQDAELTTEQNHWSLVWDFGQAPRRIGFPFPSQGSNLHSLHWKHRVLNTGPPGKSPEPLFSLVMMTSIDIILGTTKRAERVGGGWHTCSLSVYRFFASDLSAGWPFHWTCPGPGHTVDTAVKSGSGSAGLSVVLSSWWPARTSSSSSHF